MGSAQGQLNLSAKGFVDGINTAITALEKLKTKSEDASKDVKEFGDEANSTKSKTGSLGTEVKNTGDKIKGYDDKIKPAKQNTKGLGEEADKTKEKQKKLGDTLKTVGDTLTTYGDKLSKAGGTLTKYLTLPAVALGTYSVKKFADFESAMSTVQATSGATADDMQTLTEKAKEMGETTKFSATESAEALNYMAMAGWKTEDMVNGLSGVMDLAAASGEDLASTSDIVTDALTAMGYTAKDAGKLADVMAAASSNANTNVSLMGETFKYVAPVAGALGYSMEDLAVATGLMANAGIKGGQAGTALRATLSRLTNPTKEIESAMVKLGLATETVNLNVDTEKLEKAQTDVKNKTLSLTNAQTKYNDALKKYGANSSQAKTAMNNVEKAENALATAQQKLKKEQEGTNAETIITSNVLTDESGKMRSLGDVIKLLREKFKGLDSAQQAEAASTIFGQEAMSGMLAIINASDEDFAKLTEAVNESEGAAKKMSEVKLDNFAGQLTLLKSKAEGVGIQFGQQIIPYLSKFVGKIGDILTWFSKLDDSTKNLIVKGAALLAALGPILKIFGNITKAAGGLSKAFSLLASHPIVAATAVIAAGIAAITTAMTENIDVVPKEYNAYKEFSDAVRKTADEFSALKTARKQATDDVTAEYAVYEDLKKQLDGIVDANGKVKKGYENRAKFLTGKLQEATGIEIKMNGNVIQSYKQISDQIDKTIQKKKAEAYLEAYRESYTTALKNQAKAQDDLLQSEQNRAVALDKFNKVQQELNDAQAEYNYLLTVKNPTREQSKRLTELNDVIKDGKENLNKYRDELSNANTDWLKAQSIYTGYASTIKNYEEANTALITGDEKKVKEALNYMVNDFVDATQGTVDQLTKQYDANKKHYENLKQLAQREGSSVTQEQLKQAEELTRKSKEELDKRKSNEQQLTAQKKYQLTKQYEDAEQHYKDLLKLVGREGYGVTQAMVDEAKKARDGIKVQLDGIKDDAKKAGSDFVTGFSDGVIGVTSQTKTNNAIYQWTNGMTDYMKKQLGIASPSKVTKQFGLYFVQGFADGITDNSDLVRDAVAGVTDVALATLSTSPNDYSINGQSFDTVHPGTTGGISTTNQQNTFNFYSPEPIDEIEAANQFKQVQKQMAEGFI